MMFRIHSLLFGLLLVLASHASFAAGQNTTLDVVHDYMKAWNAHNADAASEYFSDNVEFLDASVGTPQVGRENAKTQVIEVFMQAVPDLQWKMFGEPIVNGESIAFEWEFNGTNTGPWSTETPATQRRLSFKGVSFIHLKNGKILTQHDYYDALGFNKQLGW
ncbi:ester cyclase [Pseudomonas sp. DR48]|uniref:ester cyclase n=1 Tax=unclassified Pseudomonas TaxID=196821 RepID=UPI0021BD63D7|nr:ester cyclase [Pseudomonas sp. DR48]